MKKKKWAAAAAALAGCLLFSGCNTVALIQDLAMLAQEEETEPSTVVSPDQRYSLDIQGTWREAEAGELSWDAALEVANDSRDCYVVLLTEAKSDFSADFTLEDYRTVVLQSMEESLDGCQTVSGGPIEVGGMAGEAVELTGQTEVELLEDKTSRIGVTYWVDFLENETDFVRVTGWTTEERADANRDTVRQVMRSLAYAGGTEESGTAV